MSASIYDVAAWNSASINYQINDIVYRYDDGSSGPFHYFYCIQSHTSNDFTADYNASKWAGCDINDRFTPTFIWVPSYSSDIDQSPRTKFIQFGDGYLQRTKDGINNNLINVNLSFENRDLAESTAINHFLYQRESVQTFTWYPPPPFNKKKKFICKKWTSVMNFYNNFTIRAEFNEVVN